MPSKPELAGGPSGLILDPGWRRSAFVRFDRNVLNPRRGLRPIVGQTQELLSLLFGPSPGGPPEAISCEFMILVDRGHGTPLCFSGSATGLSATVACEQKPRGR